MSSRYKQKKVNDVLDFLDDLRDQEVAQDEDDREVIKQFTGLAEQEEW